MRENNTHQLSRNEILRIMGLSGRVSGLANSVESIRAALREENGKLARYYTSITQNADEIKLLAARETDNEQAVAELTVKYNNIESTVQTNKQQTDAALSTLTTNLQNEVNARIAADSAQDDVFATYKSQTDRSISSIAAHWDANDHLIGYSTTTQTAEAISSAVTSGINTANTNAQGYVKALKDIINTDVLPDSSGKYAYTTFKTQTANSFQSIAAKWSDYYTQTEINTMNAGMNGLINTAQSTANSAAASAAASASWIGQNSDSIATVVAQFNSDGTLKNYSTTTQTAAMISSEVTAINNNLTTNYSTKTQTANAISSAVTAINNDLTTNYSTKTQTANAISSAVTAINNDLTTNYSTKTQTASAISSAVTAINNDLTTNYSTKTQTANAISSAVTEVNENIQKLEESWEQGAYGQTANKTLTELKTSNNYAIRYSVLVPVTSSTAFYINDGYEVNVVYFDASKKSLGSRASVDHDSSDVGKPLSITPPSNAVYGAIYIASSSALAPSGFKNTGFLVVNKEIVTQAYLSLYVDKQSVSWLTGSADNVIFNFNNRFQIQHQGTAVLEVKANGDLEITGNLKPNSNIGTINPIQIDSSGNINRKAPDGSVIPLYAGRYVRYLNYGDLAGRTYTMSADDDYVICNGNYSDKKIYLPYSPAQGKVVSIKSIGGKVLIYTSNSNHGIRKTDTIETQPVELSNYDRAELVFYAGTWWWNYMSI